MKVTAIVPDDLIQEVTRLTKGANTTDALIKALREWVSIKELSAITQSIRKHPLKFSSDDVAARLRKVNRKIS